MTFIFDKLAPPLPPPRIYASKDALNHCLVHSSTNNSLRKDKNVVFFLFCILVDRPMGGTMAPPTTYATTRNTFFPEFRWRSALRCTPESNYWRGCRCRPYSNYWGGYSQIIGGIYPVADLGGGMGGMHPPHQPKSNDFGRKISLYFE